MTRERVNSWTRMALLLVFIAGCSGSPKSGAGSATPPPTARPRAEATPPPATPPKAEPPPAAEKPAPPQPPPAPTPPSAPPSVAKVEPPAPAGPSPALLDPALAKEQAPEKFKVRFSTTQGDFIIEATRSWSPNGADRFYNLVKIGYFNDVAFFRVVSGFMAQFGIHGDPQVSAKWSNSNIPDDPVVESNKRGYVTFAKSRLPNSRSTQFFINFKDNVRLDPMGFAPFGKVIEGMEVVDKLYSGYGDAPSSGGQGPDQGRVQGEGNRYLKADFPKLDYVKSATIVR